MGYMTALAAKKWLSELGISSVDVSWLSIIFYIFLHGNKNDLCSGGIMQQQTFPYKMEHHGF